MVGETPATVLEGLMWLRWASSGYRKKRSFDDVLLRPDRENRVVPQGDWMPREDQESVLWDMIRPVGPDRKPEWAGFLEGGMVHCVTHVEANNAVPRALRAALIH